MRDFGRANSARVLDEPPQGVLASLRVVLYNAEDAELPTNAPASREGKGDELRLRLLTRRPVPEVEYATYRVIKSNNEDRVVVLNPIDPILELPVDPPSPRFKLPSRFTIKSQRSLSPSPSSRLGRSSHYVSAGGLLSFDGTPSSPPSVGVGLSTSAPSIVTSMPSLMRNSRSGGRAATPSSPATPTPLALDSPASLYAVFDGHGGESVAEFLSLHLLSVMVSHTAFPSNVALTLRESFVMVNERFKRAVERENQQVKAGSTGTVAVIVSGMLYVAWAGDSPAFLVMDDGSTETLTRPHSYSNESKRKRVQALGGVFLEDSGVFRLNGRLHYTGAGGRGRNLTGRERYLVLSSDGLTDVMDLPEIAAYVARHENRYAGAAVPAVSSPGANKTETTPSPPAELASQPTPSPSPPISDSPAAGIEPLPSSLPGGTAAAAAVITLPASPAPVDPLRRRYRLPPGLADLLAQESVDVKNSTDNVSVIIARLK
ncbi:Protein phosphatase 1F [Cladochytrium tenue]|nr:Protein phosphatase 1F [Cladochytrium tenue]